MADGVQARVLGAKLIEKRLESLLRGSGVGVVAGMNRISADLLQRSADLAPILTGDLIRSGRVLRGGSLASGVVRRTVAYGTDHALFTHFGRYRLGPVSRTKPPTEDGPIGRMYLKRPFDRHAEQYEREVIRAAARGGRFRTSRRS